MKIEQALAVGEARRHSDSGVGVYLSFATEIVIQFRHSEREIEWELRPRDIYQQMIYATDVYVTKAIADSLQGEKEGHEAFFGYKLVLIYYLWIVYFLNSVTFFF